MHEVGKADGTKCWKGVVVIAGYLASAAAAAADDGWHLAADHRWRELHPGTGGRGAGFELMDAEFTGVAFTNILGEAQGAANRVLWNGSGGAAGDFNDDGLPDLYLCRLQGTNTLYRNLGGFRFREATAEAGLERGSRGDRGAVFADVNGDRTLDLLVATTGAGVVCHLNEGPGRFREVTRTVGTGSRHGATTLALADVNGDGFLDLYVCTYRAEDLKDRGRIELPRVEGQPVVPPDYADRLLLREGRLLQYGEEDTLLLNDGKRGFKAVSWTSGAFLDEAGAAVSQAPLDWGLSATFRDLNGDGHPDLYVCNDFWTPDRMWMGDGRGGFREASRLALRKLSGSSMGVDVADVDRDGVMDLLVVEMLAREVAMRKRQALPTEPEITRVGEITNQPQVLRNTFFRGRGDGTFAEIGQRVGLPASDWSWSPVFLDVDLDGYEDVLISAGHIHDLLDLDAQAAIRAQGPGRAAAGSSRIADNRLFPRLNQPVLAFRNLGNLQFQDVTESWGTAQAAVNHALIPADFDQDGDLDLAVTRLGAAAGLYRNLSTAPRVAVRLVGRSPNGQGIGARVTLRGGTVPIQTQEMISGGRSMAGGDPQLVFAPGAVREGMMLEVLWRSGRRSLISQVQANRFYQIREPDQAPPAKDSLNPTREPPWFEDLSVKLGHTHREESQDPFAAQPSLHRSLWRSGPNLVWRDWDGDGREDLVVGAGAGGRLAVLQNRGGVEFTPMPEPLKGAEGEGRHLGMAVWPEAPNRCAFLVARAGRGSDEVPAVLLDHTMGREGTSVAVSLAPGCEPGPLAVADMDADGRADLFVGGSEVRGRYPQASPSGLLRRTASGEWRWDPQSERWFRSVGLVRGAVWTDLEADGFPELVLACEWGPIRILRNRGGTLEAWDPAVVLGPGAWEVLGGRASSEGKGVTGLTLGALSGWWSCLTPGDFDGDGRLDLVAGNWGMNSEYRASLGEPLEFWVGNWGGTAGLDLIETCWDAGRGIRVPTRRLEEMAQVLPWLKARFGSHRAYSEAGLSEVMGEAQRNTQVVRATTLATLLFLNRGETFEAVPLPEAVQWSCVQGLAVADANGDGHEDLFVAQNFFGMRAEVSRQDAGRGLWLWGDGRGGFRVLGAPESGVAVDGEGRGAAVADFDGDGRVDLAVGQHGAATRLFRNTRAEVGVRVRLEGPVGNAAGIGAVLRLWRGQQPGAAREIHGGAGAGSMDSVVAVLGGAAQATGIEVRWPGGQVGRHDLGAGTREITLRAP